MHRNELQRNTVECFAVQSRFPNCAKHNNTVLLIVAGYPPASHIVTLVRIDFSTKHPYSLLGLKIFKGYTLVQRYGEDDSISPSTLVLASIKG